MKIKIKLMPDYECWPLWLIGGQGGNLDPKKLPISESTRERLERWRVAYDDTLNREYPPDSKFISENQRESFNALGRELLQALRQELGDSYEVFYRNHWDSDFRG